LVKNRIFVELFPLGVLYALIWLWPVIYAVRWASAGETWTAHVAICV